jgi:hypothetical protein
MPPLQPIELRIALAGQMQEQLLPLPESDRQGLGAISTDLAAFVLASRKEACRRRK